DTIRILALGHDLHGAQRSDSVPDRNRFQQNEPGKVHSDAPPDRGSRRGGQEGTEASRPGHKGLQEFVTGQAFHVVIMAPLSGAGLWFLWKRVFYPLARSRTRQHRSEVTLADRTRHVLHSSERAGSARNHERRPS